MAPILRGVASQSMSHTNGAPSAFDGPPSTMAAQLINNLSTTTTSRNKPSRHVEQDDLQKLMSEVSDLENNAIELTSLEAKLEHKHKLIYVFARAVLERLTRDDPFMNFEQLVLQASEALDVFISTIKETPEVLNYVLKTESSLQRRGQEPLWIWLFPRILALLGRRECDVLTEKIKDFFYVSFQAVSRSPKMWNINSSFFCYLKDCTSSAYDPTTMLKIAADWIAILGSLQNSEAHSHSRLQGVVLPSDVFDTSVFPDHKDGAIKSNQCTYIVRTSVDGLWHATHLLSMLVDISMEAALSYDATRAFQDYIAWMLDSFMSIHEIRKIWQSTSLSEATANSELSSLCAIHALLSTLRTFLSNSLVSKGFIFLVIIYSDLLEDPQRFFEEPMRVVICSIMLNLSSVAQQHEPVCRAICLYLVPRIQVILKNGGANDQFGIDFQKASKTLCQICQPEAMEVPDVLLDRFAISSLESEFHLLGLNSFRTNEPDGPPSKRRKIGVQSDLLGDIISELYSLLGSQKASDLAGLSRFADVIEFLGRIPCAANGSLTVTRDHEGKIIKSKCFVCEGISLPESMRLNPSRCQTVGGDSILIMSKITNSPAFGDSRRSRVLAMIVLRSFTTHFTNPDFVDLEQSSLGQWCLHSLRSSLRELRVAAGRTLYGFLKPASTEEITRKNQLGVLEFLRSISESKIVHIQETCILAWSQAGRVLEDELLNIVLLKLVQYLGNPNPVLSAVAFNEILGLARANCMTIEKMFRNFWGSIAIEAVKDLLVRPQTSQLMADLLEKSVPEFLILTQAYTLPWLVLWKKTEILKKIAQARGDDVFRTCWEPSNFTAIIALLLIQNVQGHETYITALLINVSPEFKGVDFTRVEPSLTALHLLKAAGEADDAKKSRIRHGLNFLSSRAPAAPDSSRKKKTIGSFLEQHILGLVAGFSEVVNDSRDELSVSEKKRCVKGLEEMVKIGKASTRAARTQITACLQSALAQKELQASAFSAWDTVLLNLDDEDVELMLENTLSMIIQRWETFDESTKERAEKTLQYLLKDKTRLIRNQIVNLPSLSQISRLVDVEQEFNKLRTPTDIGNSFQIFSRRVTHENSGVVSQALSELKAFLQLHQSFLQASAVSEQPDIVIGQLVRSILDTCIKFNEAHHDIAQLSAECIGLIGCLDSNRVESVRERREMVVASNFSDAEETTDFVLFLLREVIVKTFLSATDTGLQGFLSYAMQELLERCNFRAICGPILRDGDHTNADHPTFWKWLSLPESVQATLTPFLNSKYSVQGGVPVTKIEYPIFCPDNCPSDRVYNNWMKTFVLDLLQKPQNIFAEQIFSPLRRTFRIKELSVASFLLPYLVLHVIILGADKHREEIIDELLGVLQYQITPKSKIKHEDLKLCSEAVFGVLDYLSRWIQQKQLKENQSRAPISAETEDEIRKVSEVIATIPADIVSRRAVECKSYSRALFNWEKHIRQSRKKWGDPAQTAHLERLQEIYTQIDEPDGIEGISAHLHALDIDQQILGHRKAGRWTTAQSWYEIKLAENPDDSDVQINLLTCLKESGQHDVLLNYVEGMHNTSKTDKLLPFAVEASWATGRWLALEKYTSMASKIGEQFNISIGHALLALHKKDADAFSSAIQTIRDSIACSMSASTTASLSSCHDTMLKFHVLTELEMIAGGIDSLPRQRILESLNRRLEVIGAYLNDKQYLLGIRRAAMKLSSVEFTPGDIASSWLTSARLARKGNAIHQSFNAVLHASQLGDDSAKIEHARLLWKEGHHRKAIQSLQGAIDSNAFISHNSTVQGSVFTVDESAQQNLLEARAQLLLAKWLDSAGQTQSEALQVQYQTAARTHSAWEKGHYYLGRHYNKLLESEKVLTPNLQPERYLTGETAKLVIENYLRSLSYGTKYIYQTLPRILTLWLDLGTQVNQQLEAKYGNSKEYVTRIIEGRREQLTILHHRFKKYIPRIPAYMLYTALPQIVARIAHPNNEVYKHIQEMIIKVVSSHPQQALWSLLALSTSNQPERKQRGAIILSNLRNNHKKADHGSLDLRALIKNGEKLTEQLLLVCNYDFQGNRMSRASITDLGFNHKYCTPSLLAVPIESVLTATLPTLTDNVKSHKAFSRDVVTIHSFLEEVHVLSSLQKPRKLTARGSNGKSYGLLCKPKDDLRKDQRLMEFNSMINRSLKRDADSSRRQLYIKTYAVTPLNEECGIIEWVDGLRTLRDILLSLYKAIGVIPNYRDIETMCDEALKPPEKEKIAWFTDKVLGIFPPVFHLWFVQQYPEPSAWFAARLRYTRSCAVMSMVGTILGLGDRHGENILFEEGNGGTFHVDFNCLFDKGLTFTRPEQVPFRLTHNMVDAMGIYGYEGPFRKSSELTLKLLRQHQDTLMTILESFVYDPTLDLLPKKGEKKKKEGRHDVPQTAQAVLDSIQRKVRGLLAGESVPLGVEGQVDELIKQATSPRFLAAIVKPKLILTIITQAIELYFVDTIDHILQYYTQIKTLMMSSSQLLKTAISIPIYFIKQVTVKEEVDFYRLVDALDLERKDLAATKVGAALEGNQMLSKGAKKNAKAVDITSIAVN
ncbi:hypothetical protein B7494_g5044 [Chlorociboria aeruginascens]|nr:hypothetical protein B7494_g5044 [Chlorociboria aeruginascens]